MGPDMHLHCRRCGHRMYRLVRLEKSYTSLVLRQLCAFKHRQLCPDAEISVLINHTTVRNLRLYLTTEIRI